MRVACHLYPVNHARSSRSSLVCEPYPRRQDSGFKNCKSDNEVGIPVIKSNVTIRDISMMVLWLEENCGEGKLWHITT